MTAFILDTETEAEVFTEAMRLRMIRSSNQQVVDAGKLFTAATVCIWLVLAIGRTGI